MSSERDRMINAQQYDATDPELVEERRQTALKLERYNHASFADPAARWAALSDLLGSLGEAVEVRPPLLCDYGWQTSIGDRTFVNFGLVALDVARIAIGADVQIGPYVQLLTATHPLNPDERRAGLEGSAPITIADGAWLGGGVIVLPGVTIGADAVVGAGAVVLRDVAPRTLVVGNPAALVREL